MINEKKSGKIIGIKIINPFLLLTSSMVFLFVFCMQLLFYFLHIYKTNHNIIAINDVYQTDNL